MCECEKKFKTAIVGASGLVGEKILGLLKSEKFVREQPVLLCSEKSAGKTFDFNGTKIKAQKLNDDSFAGVDLALFATDETVSKKFVPAAIKSGATVIDNSPGFRYENKVPLIVPELNFCDYSGQKLVSNPNCSTIQSVIPLYALNKKFGVKSVVCATYQSVSGSGKTGVSDLKLSRKNVKNRTSEFFGCDIKNNCVPKIGEYLPDGYTTEEKKMLCESRKILNLKNLELSAFCVRVPVENCHGVFLRVTTEREIHVSEALEAFATRPEIKIVSQNNSALGCPVNHTANGTPAVFIGRIRKDLFKKNVIEFYVVADNLLRGAAYNAVLIARKIAEYEIEKQNRLNAPF